MFFDNAIDLPEEKNYAIHSVIFKCYEENIVGLDNLYHTSNGKVVKLESFKCDDSSN
jgi:hypothetical protein